MFYEPLSPYSHIMTAVTLRNGARSNGWNGIKVIKGIIICHIEKVAVVNSHEIIFKLAPINTLEK